MGRHGEATDLLVLVDFRPELFDVGSEVFVLLGHHFRLTHPSSQIKEIKRWRIESLIAEAAWPRGKRGSASTEVAGLCPMYMQMVRGDRAGLGLCVGGLLARHAHLCS